MKKRISNIFYFISNKLCTRLTLYQITAAALDGEKTYSSMLEKDIKKLRHELSTQKAVATKKRNECLQLKGQIKSLKAEIINNNQLHTKEREDLKSALRSTESSLEYYKERSLALSRKIPDVQKLQYQLELKTKLIETIQRQTDAGILVNTEKLLDTLASIKEPL